MKYYLISGEASGDLHGSRLIREIRQLDPEAQIRCWGGDLMQAEGAELVVHYKERAYMGFLEVALHLRKILGYMKQCKADLLAWKPDIVVFIDYPGFNLPVAKFAKQQGFRTVFYISPQVWAWKEKRVRTIKQVIDRMLVILPFEKDFYQKWNYPVEYVGHPLVQIIREFKETHPELKPGAQPTIALLPGSRLQEILKKLPVMLETADRFPTYRFLVAQAPSMDPEIYSSLIGNRPNVELVADKTYRLLMQSHAALVTSGTATLETALFGIPEVVCYKGSALSYAIAKRVIKVKYISLVNLILDKPAVTELIQDALTADNLERELKLLLTDETKKQQLASDYKNLWELLAKGGDASKTAAEQVVAFTGER